MVVWMALVAASAGVLLLSGVIALPWIRAILHKGKPKGVLQDPPWNMRIAMGIFSILCILPALPGLTNATLYWMLPSEVEASPYTIEHVFTQLQLLLFSGLAFFVMFSLLSRSTSLNLDIDWLYRHLGSKLCQYGETIVVKLRQYFTSVSFRLLAITMDKIRHVYDCQGILSRSWPLGTTAALAAASLALYTALYYFL